ncbi:MAG: hypothetical protein ABSD48_11260 [Armatimonadota bacterium]
MHCGEQQPSCLRPHLRPRAERHFIAAALPGLWRSDIAEVAVGAGHGEAPEWLTEGPDLQAVGGERFAGHVALSGRKPSVSAEEWMWLLASITRDFGRPAACSIARFTSPTKLRPSPRMESAKPMVSALMMTAEFPAASM